MDLSAFFQGNPKWNRPTHEANRFAIMPGQAGCQCIPQTSTRVVIEMWGQGGGGGAACCCMWGMVGGQGGAYASRVFTGATAPVCIGQCISFCGCVCTCDCMSPETTGHAGQFAKLQNCNTTGAGGVGAWLGCAGGGAAGVTCCKSAESWVCCGISCNTKYDTGCIQFPAAVSSGFWAISNMSTAQNSACTGGSLLCCVGSSCYCAATLCSATTGGTQHTTAEATTSLVLSPMSTSLNDIFAPVACSCFDVYRLGACGWTKGINLGYSTWNHCDIGVGGASYAGGAQEKRNFSQGNFGYCGFAGNFPGGGGKSAGACGGGCCCGSIGGGGLIIISWA
jgi:hypothetical protein